MKNPFFKIFFLERKKNVYLSLAAFICNLTASLLEGTSFIFFLFGFNAMMGNDECNLPFASFFSHFFTEKGALEIFIYSVVLGMSAQIIRSVFSFLGQMSTLSLGTKLQTTAQKMIYDQIFKLSFRSISQYKIGDLVEYVKTPVTIAVPLLDSLNRVVLSILMMSALLVLMITISMKLTLFLMMLFVIVGVSQKGIVKKIAKLSKTNSDNIVELTKNVVQNLYGLRLILTFGRQKEALDKIDSSLDNIAKSTIKTNGWNHFLAPFNEIIGVIFVGFSLLVGVIIMKEQSHIMPLLLTFLTLTYRFGNRVPVLMGAWGYIAFLKGHTTRLREILETDDKEFSKVDGIDFKTFNQGISLENICLDYDQKPALQNINLTIKKGSVVAFVGSSGAGKSSLIDLLIQLFEPTFGRILVDNAPLNNYSLNSWRKTLGVVNQDAIIFNESIEDNIRFGMFEADDDQVMEAAKRAGAHEFISNLPEQYKTVVGERGYKLSGGERQRIALARALIRNPQILILDEATSNLDSHSESIIQMALEKLKGKKTIIMVAHRLSTVTMADQIFVLENGQILEQGSHTELVLKNGRYRYYWDLQSTNLKSLIDDFAAATVD